MTVQKSHGFFILNRVLVLIFVLFSFFACEARKAPMARPIKPLGRKVAIVGGGFTGLAAAHLLKGYTKVTVFEKESVAGGRSGSELISGLQVPIGTMSFAEAQGSLAKLLSDFHLEPQQIPEPQHSTFLNGNIYPGDWILNGWDQLPLTDKQKSDAKEIANFISSLCDSLKSPGGLWTKDAMALDEISFADLIAGYDPQVLDLIELALRRLRGTSMEYVSALSAIDGLCNQSEGLAMSAYSLPNSIGSLIDSVSKELGDQLVLGATVIDATKQGQTVSITYEKNGGLMHEDFDAVLLTTSASVAANIFSENSYRHLNALRSIIYSPYVIVMLAFDKPISLNAWRIDVPNAIFTTLYDAGWQYLHSNDESAPTANGVILAHLPSKSPNDYSIEMTDDQTLISMVMEDLSTVIPELPNSPTETHVIRHHFGMPLFGPSYITSVLPELADQQTPFFFAADYLQSPDMVSSLNSAATAVHDIIAYLKTGD